MAELDNKFDGDKMSALGVMTKEAVAESKQVMRSRNFHVRTDGSIAHSLATDTVDFLFGAMTSAPVVTDEMRALYEVDALKPATEHDHEYRGDFTSNIDPFTGRDKNVIYLNDKYYSPDVLYKNINKHDQYPVEIPISSLTYARSDCRVTEDELSAAGTKGQLLVMQGQERYLVLRGFALMINSRNAGLETIKAYIVTEADLACAELMETA